MSIKVGDRNIEARHRGMIVELVRQRHRGQRSRFDHEALTRTMQELHADVGLYHVMTYLQELCDAGYLTYREEKDENTRQVEITEIQLTHRGRQIADGFVTDPMVKI